MFAAAVGEKEMLANLISKSTDEMYKATSPRINDTDGHGLSAAVWAAQKGQLETLIMLDEAGVSLSYCCCCCCCPPSSFYSSASFLHFQSRSHP